MKGEESGLLARSCDGKRFVKRSRRERSRRESSDTDEARRVSERERANQSKPKLTHVPIESHTRKIMEIVPGGNGADGSRAT
jgi:hypothetical protein